MTCRASRSSLFKDCRGVALVLLLVGAFCLPAQAAAQTGSTVQGRVFDAGTRAGVANAVLTLEGYGYTLSSASGSFSFEGIESGSYSLVIEAFGYVDGELSLLVTGDTVLAVPLAVDPVSIRGIDVKLEEFDFRGRVKELGWASNIRGAKIVSDQGHKESSNVHGRFDLDNVYERVPLRILIQAYGYLPMDTTLVPDDDERYPFHVTQDPVTKRMTESYNEVLGTRSDGHMYEYRPAVNRADMAGLPSDATLQVVIEEYYYRHIIRRIGCLFLDERRIDDREERQHVLQSVMVSDLQRIELLEFITPRGSRGFMARIYTRVFFQNTIRARNKPLRVLTWSGCE